MECPFCGEQMREGEFRSTRDGVIYWLPRGAEIRGLFLDDEKVLSNGGMVLNGAESGKKYGCSKCRTIVIR